VTDGPSDPRDPESLEPAPIPPVEQDADPPVSPAPAMPPVEPTRRLIGASFDLLSRATEEMRRASFYIGAILVGTVGPFALATWAIEVGTVHRTQDEIDALMAESLGLWYGLLAFPALIGIFVVTIESRAMAVAILGGRSVGRPLAVRQALARSRTVFWRALAVVIMVGIPLSIAQYVIEGVVDAILPTQGQATVLVTVLATAAVGAPLAYVMTGVVLGDVGPVESLRRSFRVFEARKAAAAVVALFEVAAALLILFGLSAGLDVAYRVFDALGVGSDSGPAGLLLVTLGIVAVVFALGTLVFTVTAISIAPQVVMFVGLTHATIGLDRVRRGGDRDPDERSLKRPPFRVITRSMWVGILVAWAGLAVVAGLVLR
jgi:hypothetical protein